MITKIKKHIPVILLLSPGFILLLTFVHIPVVKTIYMSFFSTPKGRKPSKFKGIENYEHMFSDPIFWKVMSNNIVYAISTIPIFNNYRNNYGAMGKQ